MKKLFYFSFLSVLFSCSEKTEVITGKLEDFISDEISFERNLETGFLRFYTSVEYRGKESVYTYVNNVFQFFDSKTGRLIGSFKIPKEGPLSLKGGVFDVLALPGNQIVAYSEFGHVNFYSGEEILKTTQLKLDKIGPEKPISLRNNKMNFLQISDNSFEILNDPFDILASSKGDPGFDINFGAWLAQFDRDGNWLCISDFQAPYDESFQNNISSGALNRIIDSESQSSWIQFPFSDSLYQVKKCKIVDRIQLAAKTTIYYRPDIIKKNGEITTWNRPEDGSINLHLIHDQQTGLNLRVVLLKEFDGNPDETNPGKKLFSKEVTYLFLVYDPNWKLLAELEIVYPMGTAFENIFSTSKGIFINKPKQKAEDEYEFYKIDLSRFSE